MKHWRVVAVLLICLVLAGSVACLPFGGGGDEEEVKPQLVEVVRSDLVIGVSGSGSINVANEATLSFGTGGIVDKVYVEEGDEVNQGDVLAKLDAAPLELALAQAEAALATAEYDLDQAENPYSSREIADARHTVFVAEDNLAYARQMLLAAMQEGDSDKIQAWDSEVRLAQMELAIAQERLDMMLDAPDDDQIELMEMQVEIAEQSLAEAEKQLDRATLIASFDGTVVDVSADEGDTIASGVPVIHLIDPTGMELEVEVDELDIPGVKVGQKAIISADALPTLQLEGRVSYISPVSIELAGVVSYGVTITLGVPESSDLKVGMSATADIVTQQRRNVLLVPDRAIGQDSEGNLIVMVMVGEQVEERQVVIGMSDGFQTEIIDGLHEGEIVLIEVRPRESPGLFPGAPH